MHTAVAHAAYSTASQCFIMLQSLSCAQAFSQDTSLSVWRRQRGELTYTSLCYHKLTPPPSRLSNNASINLLSAAACLWWPAAVSTPQQGVCADLAATNKQPRSA